MTTIPSTTPQLFLSCPPDLLLRWCAVCHTLGIPRVPLQCILSLSLGVPGSKCTSHRIFSTQTHSSWTKNRWDKWSSIQFSINIISKPSEWLNMSATVLLFFFFFLTPLLVSESCFCLFTSEKQQRRNQETQETFRIRVRHWSWWTGVSIVAGEVAS